MSPQFQVTVQLLSRLPFLVKDQVPIRLGFDLTQISVHCIKDAPYADPLEAGTAGPPFRLLRRLSSKRVERALHKAVR